MIRVIHHHQKTNQPWEVYVGRPSPLGNPFSPIETRVPTFRVRDREEAVANYRVWLRERIEVGDVKVRKALEELRAVHTKYQKLDLVCWCHPQLCHASVLREYLMTGAINDPS